MWAPGWGVGRRRKQGKPPIEFKFDETYLRSDFLINSAILVRG